MRSAKPLDVVILRKIQGGGVEDPQEPYQEFAGKAKNPGKNWSCHILAGEDELFSVRCTNTTGVLLAVRIYVDACYVQQYILRREGEAGDTVTCHGTGSRSMTFGLVSDLVRDGKSRSRPPSETGCINVTVYKLTGYGGGLPPPERPTEQLDLPVSMDGTLWELCVTFTGDELVLGEPSPHAAEIGTASWVQFATLNFNYRTEGELFSGRIRGIPLPRKQSTPDDTSTCSSSGKRKRKPVADATSKKRRDQSQSPSDCVLVSPRSLHPMEDDGPEPITPPQRVADPPATSRLPQSKTRLREPTSLKGRTSALIRDAVVTHSSGPAATVPEPPRFVPRLPILPLRDDSDGPIVSLRQPASTDSSSRVTGPAPLEPRPQPQPQVQPSPVPSAITPPLTPHDNLEPEQLTTASTNEVDRATPTLTTLLDAVEITPLGFLAPVLENAGISEAAELKIIARKPEAFRAKVAGLREADEFAWLMLRKKLAEILEDQSAENLVLESDPVRKFVRSLDGGGYIDSEALANGLKGAGISSEGDLLVLSRNLEKYTQNITFLREFAASKKFGWAIFQVGLEGLEGRKMSTPIPARYPGASMEGAAYIKWFLDTIDPGKPLGHLADGFIRVGLTSHIRLRRVAEDIELALDAMPFFQGLASGDQLVWAMILTGLDNLIKSI